MLDLDSNGVLDKSEFFAATSKLNLNLSEDDTEQLFNKLDVNGDGVLTCDEFSDIELEGKLFSLSGLKHFFKKHIGGSEQQEMAKPGRWTLELDKFEKESKKAKQYYD
ncbi:hypothetical protein TrVE_jg3097 [Triparma verrucosa]|uniref:EF-hand domain-containing protein n=2 Tax=Triparma TaxID=722752 RepID=A0A9W7AYE2_9STRA|nr:hypothetical protein TrST_g7807 [Triparma strigata]GMH81714.1 hypothetical protein TrVE_jg3097 [Triparma verrucosa]